MKSNQLKIGKYVIVNGSPVLFPLDIVHSQVMPQGQSAGFFVIRINGNDIEVYCWGESTSLNLVSTPVQDARIIKEFITTLSDIPPELAKRNNRTGSQPGFSASSSI